MLSDGATVKPTGSPMGCERDLCPPTWPPKLFWGPKGLEVKFGQIAPYFGDQKLCVLGWFLHGFGSVLTSLSPDYGQIMEIIKK